MEVSRPFTCLLGNESINTPKKTNVSLCIENALLKVHRGLSMSDFREFGEAIPNTTNQKQRIGIDFYVRQGKTADRCHAASAKTRSNL